MQLGHPKDPWCSARPTTRWIVCEDCWGEGVIEYALAGSQYDIDPPFGERECRACDGSGWVEVELQPIEEADLWEGAA